MRSWLARLLTLLLLTMTLTASPSWAADYSGTWVLDRSASDSPDALLKAQGVSWFKRKAAAKLDVTQTIAQDGDVVTIETDIGGRLKSTTLRVDGKSRTVEGERGAAAVVHAWDGESLVSTSTPVEGESKLVTHRSISEDGKTMTQRITLITSDGSPISISRIFRMKE